MWMDKFPNEQMNLNIYEDKFKIDDFQKYLFKSNVSFWTEFLTFSASIKEPFVQGKLTGIYFILFIG